ncbi:hypothetical protein ACFPM3_22020 [Streptomyces coeruleoprunus]|uniref:Uncharacterized protein n=1 Tax=Streptomyces coeruleoprunus TaxID=285563 RepID=A0ABV9XKX5_9ACTN
MSTAPTPGPRDAKPEPEPKKKTPALIFDDPLDRPSADDTDRGWGERAPGGDGGSDDLARFLDEKPPHHL